MLGEYIQNRREALRNVTGALLAVGGASGTAFARSETDRPDSTTTRGQPSCDRRVPADHGTVQGAVDAAAEGETICVAPGTYEEAIVIDTEDVTLRSTNPRQATVDATGEPQAVRIAADGVTLAGFEIVGDDDTTTGVSIRASVGATRDITIADNHVHGVAKTGGSGVFDVSCWGVLAYGDEPQSGLTVEGNLVESIGGEPGELPAGVGIDLEDVEGSRSGEGAVVRRNRIADVADGTIGLLGVEIPGTGISIQPTGGEASGAGDPAAVVQRNEITGTSMDVVLGEAGLSTVTGNE